MGASTRCGSPEPSDRAAFFLRSHELAQHQLIVSYARPTLALLVKSGVRRALAKVDKHTAHEQIGRISRKN
jgi:hypothetical protein